MIYKVILFFLIISFLRGSCKEITVLGSIPYTEQYNIDGWSDYKIELQCDNIATLEVYDVIKPNIPVIENTSIVGQFIGFGTNDYEYSTTITTKISSNLGVEMICNLVVSDVRPYEYIGNIILLTLFMLVVLCCIVVIICIVLVFAMSWCCDHMGNSNDIQIDNDTHV